MVLSMCNILSVFISLLACFFLNFLIPINSSVLAFYDENDTGIWLNESVKTKVSVLKYQGDDLELLLEFSGYNEGSYLNSFDVQNGKMKFDIQNIIGVSEFVALYPVIDQLDLIEYGGEVIKERVFKLPFSIIVKVKLIDADNDFSFSLSYLSCSKVCFPIKEDFLIRISELSFVEVGLLPDFRSDNIVRYV